MFYNKKTTREYFENIRQRINVEIESLTDDKIINSLKYYTITPERLVELELSIGVREDPSSKSETLKDLKSQKYSLQAVLAQAQELLNRYKSKNNHAIKKLNDYLDKE